MTNSPSDTKYLAIFEIELTASLGYESLESALTHLNQHHLGRPCLNSLDEQISGELRAALYAVRRGAPAVVLMGLLPNGQLEQVFDRG